MSSRLLWLSYHFSRRYKSTLKLINRNRRLNWTQRLQKRVVFFPRFGKPSIKHTSTNVHLNHFGNSFFFLTRPLLLTALFLIRFDLLLKRIIRKKDKTLRRYWITTRVLFNLTRQSKGARMGKGKGKNLQTFQLICPLTVFIAFRGVRYGRLLFFLKFFNSRLSSFVFLLTHWTHNLRNLPHKSFRNA
uniref:ribosomal protein L16 n=1 Tax=Euplotes vannus TaxID=5939 RepID=UPI002E75CC02|nr:ribosomal protein L16 [Euplotes vannus]UPM52102.1 ribosomal protein L16 [Euplotes vannus]